MNSAVAKRITSKSPACEREVTSHITPCLVFATAAGTPIHPRNLVRHFHRTLEKACLSKKRFHDLRHTCASLLLEQGVQPRVVMEILGHSQISLTMDTYSHVIPALTREAASHMDAILGVKK